jgi:hypothetical protein
MPNNESILEKDDRGKSYPNIHRLLKKAKDEGRIDGRFRCPTCGMRFMTFDEADVCCKVPLNQEAKSSFAGMGTPLTVPDDKLGASIDLSSTMRECLAIWKTEQHGTFIGLLDWALLQDNGTQAAGYRWTSRLATKKGKRCPSEVRWQVMIRKLKEGGYLVERGEQTQ